MAFDEQSAIDSFWAARDRGVYFPTEWFDRLTLDEAYRVQLGLIDRRCVAGERQIGWKVGLTAKPIQQQFGFHEPVFGCILESRRSGHVFRPDDLIKPGFEPELCLRVLQPLAGDVAMADVRRAIDAVYPSLEIIETRGDLSAQIAVAMADNAQQKTIILGSPVPLGELELDSVAATIQINGKTVATGRGDAVLGNPLNSVVWLARKLPEFGRGIRAGDLVMSGSFTRQFPIAPGDHVDADFVGIGRVVMEMQNYSD
jgi:2-keto-4-pentenoate hydratase